MWTGEDSVHQVRPRSIPGGPVPFLTEGRGPRTCDPTVRVYPGRPLPTVSTRSSLPVETLSPLSLGRGWKRGMYVRPPSPRSRLKTINEVLVEDNEG